MEFVKTAIDGVLLIKPRVFEDDRGFFMETFRANLFREHNKGLSFVQDNLSASEKGVVRGLHYQIVQPQAKLVMVPKGKILDVAVDIRLGSPTFGKYVTAVLSGENKHQFFIPEGFAHGYSVLEPDTLVSYKCSDYYNADAERGVRWNDPELGIEWQVKSPIVSEKDRRQPLLAEIEKTDLFTSDL